MTRCLAGELKLLSIAFRVHRPRPAIVIAKKTLTASYHWPLRPTKRNLADISKCKYKRKNLNPELPDCWGFRKRMGRNLRGYKKYTDSGLGVRLRLHWTSVEDAGSDW